MVQKRGHPETAAREIAAALQDAGHQALFAGGCVRDRLLGLDPEDFDIATSDIRDIRWFSVGFCMRRASGRIINNI